MHHAWGTNAQKKHQDVSAAAIFLVSKIGPTPRSTRDISNVYAYLLSSESTFFHDGSAATEPPKDDPRSYYQTDADYFAFQNRILALEAQILTAVGFDAHVSLPHALAITYLQTLDFASHDKTAISKRTLQYLNTALLSPQMLYLTHQPHALATAAIYNAAKDVGAKMPDCAWWEVFDVDREELGFLVVGMRSVEGLLRERKSLVGQGMITRSKVEEEMRRRGLPTSSGSKEDDQENEVMKMMDER